MTVTEIYKQLDLPQAIASQHLITLKDKGVLYLSFMAGKKAGFEQTSFSQDPIYFNYYSRDELERFLSLQGVTVVHSAEQGYLETDGTLTNDIFLFGKRL